jgi:ribosomal protein S16
MASSTMNSLKVRRTDLLEQLQERYVFMTAEKEKYDKALVKFQKDDEAHDLAVAQYEKDVRNYLHSMVRTKLDSLDYGIRHDTYNRSSYRVTAEASVDVSEAQVIRAVGKYPTRPKEPERPVFLQTRRGRSWSDETPSIYESVYQAIQVLSMSDDYEVKAQMFNDALIAL